MESNLVVAAIFVLVLLYFWREVLGLLLVATVTLMVAGLLTVGSMVDRLSG